MEQLFHSSQASVTLDESADVLTELPSPVQRQQQQQQQQQHGAKPPEIFITTNTQVCYPFLVDFCSFFLSSVTNFGG